MWCKNFNLIFKKIGNFYLTYIISQKNKFRCAWLQQNFAFMTVISKMWCHSRRHTCSNGVKIFSKTSQIVKEFLYWNFFSASWLDVSHVKEDLWCNSCSGDVTLCKNILPIINFSSHSSFLQKLYTIQRSYH